MGEIDKTLWYLFILSLVLIGVAYYTGLKSDVGAFSSAINNLGLTFTGRNSQGQFAAYPTGG